MKTKNILVAILLVSLVGLISCKDGSSSSEEKPVIPTEPKKPNIELKELGEDNTKTVLADRNLWVKADITAEAKIAKVTIELVGITDKDGKPQKEEYTSEFEGKENIKLEKYLPIAQTVTLGEYTCKITVMDKLNRETSIEAKFKVIKPTDKEKPEMDITKIPTPYETFESNDRIIVGGTITDNEGLKNILVSLVRFDKEIKDEDISTKNAITLFNSSEFDRPTSHLFEAYIIVGVDKDNNNPARDLTSKDWYPGEYYILIRCEDKSGNISFSRHHPIQIIKKG